MMRAAAFAPRMNLPMPLMARWFSGADGVTIHKGVVKWFDTIKGFGFLTPADGSADVFVHQSAIFKDGFRSLADGEQVEFKIIKNEKGKVNAKDVTGPNGAYVQGKPPRTQEGF